jgi:hypothetical protein
MMIWDMLPHGGASQIHPHIHNFLDRNRYQGTGIVLLEEKILYTTTGTPVTKACQDTGIVLFQ